MRTLEICRKHSPAARVFYILLMFSNARRVSSQCNTWLSQKQDLREKRIYSIVNERKDRTYSAHYQPTVSRIQLLYLHSECHCSGWSGDIHYNIHTRMFQGNCSTSVSILRSLLNTRWYLKTDKPCKKFNVVSLVQSKSVNLHTKERLLFLHRTTR